MADTAPEEGDADEGLPDEGGAPEEGRNDAEERERTFERSIVAGHERLNRTIPVLAATGVVGGFDVGLGVMAQFVVLDLTDSVVLGALAFTIGFVALVLGRSELFTEDFLVPVTTVITHDGAGIPSLLRLWSVTLVTNLAGGFAFMVIAVEALPAIGPLIEMEGGHFVELGFSTEAFASAVLGGFVITLMTWMERGSDGVSGKLIAAFVAAFLLAAGPLNHSIVRSLEMFGALIQGTDFGYADWAGAFGLAVLGNMVGGLGLVTVIRLVQVGGAKIGIEQRRSDG